MNDVRTVRKVLKMAQEKGRTVEFWTSSSLWEVNWNAETQQFDFTRHSEWEGTESFSNSREEAVESLTKYTQAITQITTL